MIHPDGDEYLTTTISACGSCRRLLPARVHRRGDRIVFHKDCPDHGPQEALVSSDAEHYLNCARFHRAGSIPREFRSAGETVCPFSCGLCPRHEQHVCMPILEITDRCDLSCPICLVDNRSTHNLSREDVARILDRIIAAEGRIDVLNLSGGEPTLNPDFLEIVDECASREEILRTSVSTNGLRLLEEPGLLRHLKDRDVVVSLQFDGFEEDAYRALRGLPLLDAKRRLIDEAGRLDLPLSLTATVASGINLERIGAVLDLLFERDHILSVMIQPMAYTGRAARLDRPAGAATIPDVLRALEGARDGLVSKEDFSPLPCSHPSCFSLAFYLRVDGDFIPMKNLIRTDRYLDILENRAIFGTDPGSFEAIQGAVYDLWSGPSALAPDSRKALAAARRLIGAIDGCCFDPRKALVAAERSIKSIFIHAFMDPHTFDLARARKCCNVYPQPDGRLLPACVRNCMPALP